eukprot:2858110-Pyramimonas_sp.AAC.1
MTILSLMKLELQMRYRAVRHNNRRTIIRSDLLKYLEPEVGVRPHLGPKNYSHSANASELITSSWMQVEL